jgi:hypothetical protein
VRAEASLLDFAEREVFGRSQNCQLKTENCQLKTENRQLKTENCQLKTVFTL